MMVDTDCVSVTSGRQSISDSHLHREGESHVNTQAEKSWFNVTLREPERVGIQAQDMKRKSRGELDSSSCSGGLNGQHGPYDPARFRQRRRRTCRELYGGCPQELRAMSEEIFRVQKLRSYSILGQKEPFFDHIAALARHAFDVPIAMISLIDIDRLWFLSSLGVEPSDQIPRDPSFCSNLVKIVDDILVIPDTKADPIFKEYPQVIGPPFVRFFAGVPIVSPEGYKIGALCVMDQKPRFDVFSDKDKDALKSLSALALRVLEERKFRIETEARQEQVLATTSHDLLTPLTGLQMALALIQEDKSIESKLDVYQRELIATASACSDILSRVCKRSLENLRDREQRSTLEARDLADDAGCQELMEIVECIRKTMLPIPKVVPLLITLDKSAPKIVNCDELKLYRIALNFVATACTRTQVGSVHLKFSGSDDCIVIECFDTGPNVSPHDIPLLFEGESFHLLHDKTLASLQFVDSQIDDLGGDCGYRPNHESGEGSVFWCTLPNPPNTVDVAMDVDEVQDVTKTAVPEVPITLQDAKPSASLENFQVSSDSSDGSVTESESGGERISHVRYIEGPFGDVPHAQPPIHKKMSSGDIENQLKFLKPFAAPFANTAGCQRRALVVDDSLIVRKCMSNALKRLDFDVTVSHDGMDGLQKLKESVYDLVFCDFLMPNMDGMDCVSQYREWEQSNRPDTRLHIIGISAHASEKDFNKGLQIGMDRILPKPVTVKCLEEIVKSRYLLPAIGAKEAGASNHQVGHVPIPPTFNHRTTQFSIGASMLESTITNKKTRWCLIVTSSTDRHTVWRIALLERGWLCEVATTSDSALLHLKQRNWDAVLVDQDLLPESCTRCISTFRDWEASHRVNRQDNVLLTFATGSRWPHFNEALVSSCTVPHGFDGAVSLPVVWDDFERVVCAEPKHEDENQMNIITR